ncbi:MAG TPA: STAS domain-containing protein [Methylomirabilota bacterium]|nr:STAS domain-containing protein [Methylomirabilota bacterium]
MHTENKGEALLITGFHELSALNVAVFRDLGRNELKPGHARIDVDLTQTRFLDSSGIGGLISLHKTMCERKGKVRLINPAQTVQQVLELTRMHRLFEIVHN